MGLFGGNAISWTNRAKCPPIDDCPVKNTVRKGSKPTKKQQQEIAKAIAAQQAASKTKRSARQQPEPEQKRAAWPFAGRYDPKKDRGRG